MDQQAEPRPETFNPWSVVNLVFHHLAEQGLHPILGDGGDPGAPAAELLRCLGIEPAAEGNREESRGHAISTSPTFAPRCSARSDRRLRAPLSSGSGPGPGVSC